MAPFVRLSADRPRLDGLARVLKPSEYQAAVTAADIIRQAEARAAAIVKQAEDDHEASKQRGHAEGLAAAKVEIAEQMLTLVDRSVDYLAKAEGDVAATILTCLRRILGEFPEEELVLRIAREALGRLYSETRVTLHVHPELEPKLRERMSDILGSGGGVGYLEIAADVGLPKEGCRLETELGVVDASLDLQLEAIERVIQSKVKGHVKAGNGR